MSRTIGSVGRSHVSISVSPHPLPDPLMNFGCAAGVPSTQSNVGFVDLWIDRDIEDAGTGGGQRLAHRRAARSAYRPEIPSAQGRGPSPPDRSRRCEDRRRSIRPSLTGPVLALICPSLRTAQVTLTSVRNRVEISVPCIKKALSLAMHMTFFRSS